MALEFTDRAVELIYSYTVGNPYFTKLLCKSIFKLMVNRRDAHVTETEVRDACVTELRNIDVNSFVHFWEDGIVEKGAERERVFLIRRKTLLAFGEVLRQTGERASLQQIQGPAREFELSDDMVREEMEEFVQRQVFEEAGGSYRIKVRFFSEWLREFGVAQILSRLTGRIASIERKASEAAYVRSEEIFELVRKWGRYKGQTITSDHVRLWLRQFGSNANQRLMFKLLKSVRFYSESEIRGRLVDLQGMISKDVTPRFRHGVGRAEEIAVSFLEGPGKSGYQYARLYAEENKVVARNVIEPSKIVAVSDQNVIKAVLWIDDFIGTGESALERFEEYSDQLKVLQKQRGMTLFFGAIAGLQASQMKVEEGLRALGLQVTVRVCDPLSERDCCFSAEAAVFADDDEVERAKRAAEDFGRRLWGKYPLGFGHLATAVVFERSCPNNNLPILWASSNDWLPLFPR